MILQDAHRARFAAWDDDGLTCWRGELILTSSQGDRVQGFQPLSGVCRPAQSTAEPQPVEHAAPCSSGGCSSLVPRPLGLVTEDLQQYFSVGLALYEQTNQRP